MYVPVSPKTEHRGAEEYDKNHRKWFLSLKFFSSFYLWNSEFTLKTPRGKKSTSSVPDDCQHNKFSLVREKETKSKEMQTEKKRKTKCV